MIEQSIEAIGRDLLLASGAVFLLTMTALVIWAVRSSPEPEEGEENFTLGRRKIRPEARAAVRSGSASLSKRIFSGETWIAMESLVDGSATSAQRAAVLGIIVALASFWLVFVGFSLTLFDTEGPSAFLLVLIPSVWFGGIARHVLVEFIAARRKQRGSRCRTSQN